MKAWEACIDITKQLTNQLTAAEFFLTSQHYQHFTEPDDLSRCPEDPTNCPHPESNQSCTRYAIYIIS